MTDVIATIAALALPVLIAIRVEEDWSRRRRWNKARRFNPPNVHGGARFATDKDIAKGGYSGAGGIRVGFSPDGRRAMRYRGPGHLLLVAGARAGKLLTILVTTILSLGANFSLLVFDPKVELACITAHERRRFGRVIIINPFQIFMDRLRGLDLCGLNPMDILDSCSIAFHATCDKLADAICPLAEAGPEQHWMQSAAQLVSGIIAALAKYGAPSERNLVALRNILTGSNGKSVFEFCREAMKLPDEFIRQKLGRFALTGAEENKEMSAIISTAITQTGFIGNEAIANCLKKGGVLPRDLKRKAGTTVYICLPLNKLDVCSPFMRLILAVFLADLLEEGTKKHGAPVLAIVDEAAQIGPLRAFMDAWGMAAGAAGLQLFAIYQSLSQIMGQFGERWSDALQNSGVSMWFGIRDTAGQELVSKMAGITEIITQSKSVNADQRTGEPVVGESASQTTRPLIHPHEVGQLAQDEMLMFCEGVPHVVKAKREPYTKTFWSGYRDNPYYQKRRR